MRSDIHSTIHCTSDLAVSGWLWLWISFCGFGYLRIGFFCSLLGFFSLSLSFSTLALEFLVDSLKSQLVIDHGSKGANVWDVLRELKPKPPPSKQSHASKEKANLSHKFYCGFQIFSFSFLFLIWFFFFFFLVKKVGDSLIWLTTFSPQFPSFLFFPFYFSNKVAKLFSHFFILFFSHTHTTLFFFFFFFLIYFVWMELQVSLETKTKVTLSCCYTTYIN